MRKCVEQTKVKVIIICHRFVPYRSGIHNNSKMAEANLMKFSYGRTPEGIS